MAELATKPWITLTLEVSDAIPEWMPTDIVDACTTEIAQLGDQFVEQCTEVQARYEEQIRERLGRNVLPFNATQSNEGENPDEIF